MHPQCLCRDAGQPQGREGGGKFPSVGWWEGYWGTFVPPSLLPHPFAARAELGIKLNQQQGSVPAWSLLPGQNMSELPCPALSRQHQPLQPWGEPRLHPKAEMS